MTASKHQSLIKLDQFLKWQQLVQTGGEAKVLIQSGVVHVNDVLETRRGRKLIEGDLVKVGSQIYRVRLTGVELEINGDVRESLG